MANLLPGGRLSGINCAPKVSKMFGHLQGYATHNKNQSYLKIQDVKKEQPELSIPTQFIDQMIQMVEEWQTKAQDWCLGVNSSLAFQSRLDKYCTGK